MAGQQKGGLTASPWSKLMVAFYEAGKKMGLELPMTQIHNHSNQPIFLIPFFCTAGADPLRNPLIREDLAKKIPARQTIVVNSSKYECHDMNNRIRILFLARSESTDNLGEFLTKPNTEGVKAKDLLPHTFLLNHSDLNLKYSNGKVIPDENAAQQQPSRAQGSARTDVGPQVVSDEKLFIYKDGDLQSIIELVIQFLEGLSKVSTDLQSAVATLKKPQGA